MIQDHITRQINVLHGIFRSGKKKGVFRDIEPLLLATSFSGLSTVFMQHMLLGTGEIPDTDPVETILNIFFNGVLSDGFKKKTS